MKLHLEDVIGEGEKVLVGLRATGTCGGNLMGVRPTGRINIDVFDLFQFHDGILVKHWALIDNLSLLRQIEVTED